MFARTEYPEGTPVPGTVFGLKIDDRAGVALPGSKSGIFSDNDAFGTVVGIRRNHYEVRMDHDGKVRPIPFDRIYQSY